MSVDAAAGARVDVEATGRPVCDKARKGAITDCEKSGVNKPWSAARPGADPCSLSLLES